MNSTLTSIMLFVISILTIAVSSISIQYVNSCAQWSDDGPSESRRSRNKTFTIITLVCGILGVVGTIAFWGTSKTQAGRAKLAFNTFSARGAPPNQ